MIPFTVLCVDISLSCGFALKRSLRRTYVEGKGERRLVMSTQRTTQTCATATIGGSGSHFCVGGAHTQNGRRVIVEWLYARACRPTNYR